MTERKKPKWNKTSEVKAPYKKPGVFYIVLDLCDKYTYPSITPNIYDYWAEWDEENYCFTRDEMVFPDEMEDIFECEASLVEEALNSICIKCGDRIETPKGDTEGWRCMDCREETIGKNLVMDTVGEITIKHLEKIEELEEEIRQLNISVNLSEGAGNKVQEELKAELEELKEGDKRVKSLENINYVANKNLAELVIENGLMRKLLIIKLGE